MDKAEIEVATTAIVRCLTEDFSYYGLRKDGKPRKRPLHNCALFDPQRGHAVFNGTDLRMVVEAVVLGLYLAVHDREWVLSDDQKPEEGAQ